ncbi:MAG TPA: glycosyltransferase family 39 protein [Ignavibacteria bacterium]
MAEPQNIKKVLIKLIIISTIIRVVLAIMLELTNDEVNYWLYAKFPAISHYEHPPMVGFFIQLTTINLKFDSEFFLRLSSLILGAFNTYMIFAIGKKIKDGLTGLYAAFLFTASFYCFIVAGVFIHPDTPMLFFGLISIYLLIDGFFGSDNSNINTSILFAGFSIGMAILSKYLAVHLWAGVILYVLLYDRKWLKRKEIYIAPLISLLCILPVIIWNVQNESNTLLFWQQNVNMLKSGLRFDLFLPEIAGQIFYNNPVNFFIIVISIIGINKALADKNLKRMLLLMGIPLPLLLLFISFTGRTLPHWSAPGYIALILIAGIYLSEKYMGTAKVMPVPIMIAASFAVLIIIFGVLQINYGIINFNKDENLKPIELGRNDVTLDMYGWKQAAEKFAALNKQLVEERKLNHNAPIFSNKWYNSSHVDYYIARPIDKMVFTVGSMGEIRKYDWVNRERGGYENVTEAYYISPSRDYQDPKEKYRILFSSIIPVDTIRVERSGKLAENMFVYIMKK